MIALLADMASRAIIKKGFSGAFGKTRVGITGFRDGNIDSTGNTEKLADDSKGRPIYISCK